MSNNRKTLFSRPSEVQPSINTNRIEQVSERVDDIDRFSYTKLVRKELLLVLGIVIIIGLIFTVMLVTNNKNGWVERKSEILVKKFIRGY